MSQQRPVFITGAGVPDFDRVVAKATTRSDSRSFGIDGDPLDAVLMSFQDPFRIPGVNVPNSDLAG